MPQKNNLYLITNDYRSAKRDKTLKGANFFNFKKNDYAYGRGYKGDNPNVKYGDMILIDDKYILPKRFCQELSDEQEQYVLSMIPKEKKQNAEGNIDDTNQIGEKIESGVEKLNQQGKEAVRENTEKLKKMGLTKINNIKNSYTSTGLFFGGVLGIIAAVYFRKGIWASVGIATGCVALGGFIGYNFQKKHDKNSVNDSEINAETNTESNNETEN